MEFLKGRVVLAIILNSFRTSSQVEVQCDVSHLNALQFNGDSHLHEFYNKWTEIHSMIREEDLPSDKFLRDMLYNKLEDKSQSLAMDLREFDRMDEADKKCEFLLEAIRNRIRKNQEKKLVQTRMNELNKLVSQKALPFEGDEDEKRRKKPKAKAEPKAKATPSKEAEKPDPKANKRATPVYPSPSPKRHAGKPSKPGSSKDRSPSRRDPKKTPCMYHFTKHAETLTNVCSAMIRRSTMQTRGRDSEVEVLAEVTRTRELEAQLLMERSVPRHVTSGWKGNAIEQIAHLRMKSLPDLPLQGEKRHQ